MFLISQWCHLLPEALLRQGKVMFLFILFLMLGEEWAMLAKIIALESARLGTTMLQVMKQRKLV